MKRVLIIFFLTFILSQGHSQDFNFGFNAGLNYTGFAAENPESDKITYKPGFQINGILEYNFNNKLGFRFEPGYSRRGAILGYSNTPDIKVNLGYFTLPFICKFSPTEKISIFLGPEYSFKVTTKGESDNHSIDLKRLYNNPTDLGINTGLSYLLTDNFELGLRYYRGFTSTIGDVKSTDNQGYEIDTIRLFNQGVTCSIAYIIK